MSTKIIIETGVRPVEVRLSSYFDEGVTVHVVKPQRHQEFRIMDGHRMEIGPVATPDKAGVSE